MKNKAAAKKFMESGYALAELLRDFAAKNGIDLQDRHWHGTLDNLLASEEGEKLILHLTFGDVDLMQDKPFDTEDIQEGLSEFGRTDEDDE